jgi:sec-independent protein translocase protein TatC
LSSPEQSPDLAAHANADPAAPADVAPPDAAASPDADKGPDGEPVDDVRMSLLEHLQELRVRLRNAAIAFLVAMVIGFAFVNKFFALLVDPVVRGMEDAGVSAVFNVRSMTEGFWVMMKVAIVFGLIVAGPFVFWEIWKFVAPGLYRKEKRMALLVTGATGACFAGGAIFGWKVLARSATFYLTKLAIEFGAGPFKIDTEYMLEDTTNFLVLLLAGCGAAFEVPVVLVVLGWTGVVSAKGLWKFNKYALVLSVVVGAVLTPSPDPFNQLLLAGPLYALYNLSIVFVLLIERTRKKDQAALEKSYEAEDKAAGPPAPAT